MVCGVIVIELPTIVVDHVFKPQSSQIKDFKIGIFCFSAKHAELMTKKK